MNNPGFVTFTGQILGKLFPQRSLTHQPQRIIVLKPCCLGDVVLATPVIAALKHYYPQASLNVAVGSWSRAVLENNPHIETLIDSGRVGQGTYGWADIRLLARQLKAGNYDLAITLDRSPLVGMIPWLARIPNRVGLDSARRGFAHTMRIPVLASPRHEADIYLDTVFALQNRPPETPFWTTFYPTDEDVKSLPPLPDKPFVILHPAGGVNPGMTMLDKRWPAKNFSALADRLTEAGYAVILSGTQADEALCQQIAGQINHTAPLILAGKLSLGQFGALCQRAALFIGGDTGAMHIAVACGCKTIAIFGPSDPKRYGPFAPPEQAIALWRPIALPRGGVGQGDVPDFSWDAGITVGEVWQACLELAQVG